MNRGAFSFKSAFDCSTALMFAGEISDRFKRSIRRSISPNRAAEGVFFVAIAAAPRVFFDSMGT
jgi:hypothetical protein